MVYGVGLAISCLVGHPLLGYAVGAATNEPDCLTIDEWKRTRLIGVGADMIIPNYLNRTELLDTLFPGEAH